MSQANTPRDPDRVRAEIRRVLMATRRRTLRLIEPLDDEELHRQSHDFLSPVVWDVGHVGNFEELWLARRLGQRPAHDERLDHLYNAFENPRWSRGDLPILPRAEALGYLADVRHEVLAVLETTALDPAEPLVADGFLPRMISQHESQHQETILQSLDLRVDLPPYPLLEPATSGALDVEDTEQVTIPGGPFVLGTNERVWTYDNERPACTIDLPTFAIDRYPATSRRFAEFIAAGGYRNQRYWTPDGWAWLQETGHQAPQGWRPDGAGGWTVQRLGRRIPLDPAEPVQHISYYEAQAFATWAGGRLPTEIEWEKAAGWDPARRRKRRFPWGDGRPTPRHANVGLHRLHPRPVGSCPAGASAYGVEQLAGDVYEWTSSEFLGYPGFSAFPYKEYSEVFFGGDYRVLRGSSWAIAPPLARVTYRNWDHPYRRQIMAGVRVAYDR